MVVRGGHCSNPTKVHNIENFGGQLALIADRREEDVSEVIMRDVDEQNGIGAAIKI